MTRRRIVWPAAAQGASEGWLVAIAWLPPVLLGLAAVWLPYLPNSAGRIGEDYSMWLPNLLAGDYWHVQNGLFSVPWFNPAQCGGIPVQADPQGEFFSLTQFLSFVMPPLRAVQVAFFAFAGLGYAGTFLLARQFRLSVAAAVLAAALFALNSFYAGRMVAGHLSFSPFMLLPLAAACLIGRAGQDRSALLDGVMRCAGFGLLLGLMIEGGMLVLLPPAYLSLLMVIALYAAVAGDITLLPLWRPAAGTALGLLMCAGKLAAVLALMAHIPRDAYSLPGYLTLAETLWVTLRALFIGPAGDMQSHLANASVLFQRHEFEYSVGPAALVLLFGLAISRRRRRARPDRPRRLALDLLVLLLLVPVAVNTYGEHWTGLLKALPVIRNSSSLLRWFAAYILPVVLATGIALDEVVRMAWPRAPARAAWVLAGTAMAVTLAALLGSDHGAYGPADIGGYDPAPIDAAWRAAAATGTVPPVTDIGVLRDAAGRIDTHGLARQDSMAQGQSQLFCYDALFGYRLENFPQGALHPGRVFEQTPTPSGPVLNLKNPACYVFPGANACTPGDPFAASDIDQARRFVSYKPFSWRKPAWASAADWAGYSLWPTTILALMAAFSVRIIARRPRRA
jgi:hypothetical protein